MFFSWNNALDGLKTHLKHTAEYREARVQPQGHLKLLNTEGKGTQSLCKHVKSLWARLNMQHEQGGEKHFLTQQV